MWFAALLIAGACTAGVDKLVGPSASPSGPNTVLFTGAPTASGVVISQVYGGGGNSGSTYKNDYIELYNGGSNDVNLAGWSVQYASATGTSWAVTNLTGTLEVGHYYLVQEAAGAAGTTSLPAPNATGSIAMSATAGKVALVGVTTPISGSGCPLAGSTTIVDFAGFGSTASCFEGAGPTPAPSNTNAVLRKDGGRTDTNVNSADFAAGAPTPRNMASPALPPLNTLQFAISPTSPAVQTGTPVTFTASATKGGSPVVITSQAFSSSNTTVATIDAATGVATTLAIGTTTISVAVTTGQGNGSASTTLTVSAAPATVTVSPATWSLKVNQTKTFTASAVDAGGQPVTTTYTWSSLNPAVATVNATTGVATGVAVGTTMIRATSANGKTGDATITVTPITGFIGVQGRSNPLPVGFQTQLFLNNGGTDATGHSVGNADVTWSSAAPSIVSVNPTTGVLTSNSVGSVAITATAKSDGVTTASTTITTSDPVVSPTARTGHNTDLGIPTDADPSDDVIIARRQYTTSYNPRRGVTNWVSWNLDASHKGSVVRCNCMSADGELTSRGLPAYDTNDWINNGTNGQYSRGHMSPSADWNVDDADNARTFYLTNMLPQNQAMNGGPWGDFENYLRTRATGSAEIYIVSGGIFTKDRHGPGSDGFGTISNGGKISIPDSVWKVAIIVPDGRDVTHIGSPAEVEVIAINTPNEAPASGATYNTYSTTIDKIQKSTGYDFLSSIPESIQCRMETRNCAPTARITGAGLSGGNEGQSFSFSASTSTDPDNDALSYVWKLNGTPVGSSASLTSTIADNGSYELKLVVTDGRGGADSTSATIAVENVAPTVSGPGAATVAEGSTYSSSGSFADPGDDSWSATVDYGDGSGVQPLLLSGKTFALSHTYADNGTYAVSIVVTELDPEAASGAFATTVTVTNVSPAVAAFDGATILRGETYSASGSFTDPGADTWTASADYGDGSGSAPLALADKSFQLAHVYGTAGTFTAIATVTDDDNGVGSNSARVTVLSASQGVDVLAGMVGSLDGSLNKGQVNSLQAKLRATAASFRRDSGAGVNQLGAFINEIEAMVQSGKITEAEGAPLIAYANRVIAAAGG